MGNRANELKRKQKALETEFEQYRKQNHEGRIKHLEVENETKETRFQELEKRILLVAEANAKLFALLEGKIVSVPIPEEQPEPPDVYEPAHVARLFGCSTTHISNLEKKNFITKRKMGNGFVYHGENVRDFKRSRLNVPPGIDAEQYLFDPFIGVQELGKIAEITDPTMDLEIQRGQRKKFVEWMNERCRSRKIPFMNFAIPQVRKKGKIKWMRDLFSIPERIMKECVDAYLKGEDRKINVERSSVVRELRR